MTDNKGIRPIGSEVPLPTDSKHLQFVNKVENPIDKEIKLYNPYAVLGLDFEEVPAEITKKAEEVGFYKVVKKAQEIIALLEKALPILTFVLGWFGIEPKKKVSVDERVGAVIEAISKVKINN